ncbi:hypothetical protein ACO2Q0_10990 [Phenylobacterium sp. VNQ135]|uniref:hypothetical protein n=1 Tax=Phenylobacterium sp. VNQ135 TaxID=3400922 RepID=UPI003C01AF80
MAARKPAAKTPVRPALKDRTPLAEWTAAALGAVLTIGVIGYSIWEVVSGDRGPPVLQIETKPAEAVAGGHVVPLIVRNDSHATAAEVEVRGVLEQAGRPVEERRAVFAYVPGGGEARGGLVFERDPAAFTLRVSAEGYEEP